MKTIDLHLHTTASDGNLSSKELIDLAIKRRIKAIAITDHDSVSGIEEALEYAKNKNIKVIPGVEISCFEPDLYENIIHIIGLFINPKINIKEKKGIREAVLSIKKAGGISILAHPGIYLNKTRKIIEKFIACEGQGIEVYYPYEKIYNFDKDLTERIFGKLKNVAEEHNLLISGGSDFHGKSRKSNIGDAGVSEGEFGRLKREIR